MRELGTGLLDVLLFAKEQNVSDGFPKIRTLMLSP
jgi:hypothetical protein